MHDTTIAAKLLGQLESFLGRISPHFHKPVARFIGDMVYGIMVEKDVKLSSVVRALKRILERGVGNGTRRDQVRRGETRRENRPRFLIMAGFGARTGFGTPDGLNGLIWQIGETKQRGLQMVCTPREKILKDADGGPSRGRRAVWHHRRKLATGSANRRRPCTGQTSCRR